ncbi:Multidrug resistance-associated protein 1 [Dinochytrium kinnereticum]|nr:Multidrug resistance-associated protein 1 [Dinochytrium kinnereticum]
MPTRGKAEAASPDDDFSKPQPLKGKAPGPEANVFQHLSFFFFGNMGRDRPWTGGIMPEPYVGFFSRSTYQWMEKFIITGNRRALNEEDLFVLEGDLTAKHMTERLSVAWERELARNPKPHLQRALWAAFKWDVIRIAPYRLISDTISALSPLLVLALVRFLADTGRAMADGTEAPPASTGYMYAVILGLAQMVAGWCTHKYFDKAMRAGFRVRSALTASLYSKCLRLSPKGRQSFSSGAIVNIMATDMSRMERGTAFLNLVWSVPYLFIVAMALLVYNVGVAAIAGLVLLLFLAPFQVYAMKFLAVIRGRASHVTDKRVKVTQEALTGVRVMKLYAWENSFLASIKGLRKNELVFVRILLILRGGISALTTIIPAFAAIATFGVFSNNGGTLDAPRVFASLALFNVLRIPCMLIPLMATELTDAKVAMDRLNAIMTADELDSPPTFLPSGEANAIRVANADFIWDVDGSFQEDNGGGGKEKKEGKGGDAGGRVSTVSRDKKEETTLVVEDSAVGGEGAVDKIEVEALTGSFDQQFTLKGVNISIPRGSLVAIVGVVGAGKSSLLNGLVGEMKRTAGEVEFSGTVGYCPQTAWIQNSTLKENILFGAPLDEKRYAHAIKSCALERDLTVLPAGDDTEIGERGINLSGGQRQRVSLARAVYFDAEIVLLDDPLSAVDAHVGRYLFEKCICGALGGKTRLLVTHQLHFLPQADYIYMMDKGVIIEQGSYSEMMASNGRFAKLVSEYGNPEAEEGDLKLASTDSTPEVAHADLVSPSPSRTDSEDSGETAQPDGFLVTSNESRKIDITAKASAKPILGAVDEIKKGANVENDPFGDGKLMTKEYRATGSLSSGVVSGYVKAAGGTPSMIVIIILLILAQLARIGTDLWLTWWSANRFSFDGKLYLDVYISWGFIQVVTALGSGMTFAFAGILAARRLHNRSLSKVFRAPTEYFGRILNRFSKDVDTLDSLVPESARMVTYTLSLILGTVCLICAVFPYFIAVLIPTGVAYYFVQSFFRNTTRELKRLDSVMRSPLFAHFASGLSGLATIRAYGVQKKFTDKNLDLLDWTNRAYFPLLLSQRWLGLRLEAIATFMILCACIFAVAARFTVGAGLAGLTISYSLQITGVLNWCVREFTELEQHLVSAERMLEFDDLKEEAPEVIETARPPKAWPTKGEIKFEGLELRYRDGLPLVLKGVDIQINPGEKVAIVGRTGAGKSTIILALLRLVEPSGGKVLIDGLDIGQMGLFDLRKRLAVIPQDPVLFSGTLRSNLDPFNEYTDHELWDVLARSDLKNVVSANAKQLEMPVSEGGENWSTGQRQLICLARAMLRNAPIVILDEATASVDLATDDFIQKAIRRDFKGKTVLTIAHRLNTVIDYDRVLVLDAGKVAEFDSPNALLANTSSQFYAMVSDTGEANADMLKSLAGREKSE